MTVEVVVSTAGTGTYVAHVEGREVARSRTPLLAAARALQVEGMSPRTLITMRWAGSDVTAMRSTVGAAARLSVSEDDGGTRFVAYRPGPDARMPLEPVDTARTGPSRVAA